MSEREYNLMLNIEDATLSEIEEVNKKGFIKILNYNSNGNLEYELTEKGRYKMRNYIETYK